MIYAMTGHRPDKLGGYGMGVLNNLVTFAQSQIAPLATKPTVIISGMAQGWDLATAIATIRLRDQGLPVELWAYVPFSSQYTVWADRYIQFLYTKVLCRADRVNLLHRGAPSCKDVAVNLLDQRNRAMIDDADQVMALWNGTRGGTANACSYAWGLNKPISIVWGQWEEFITVSRKELVK